MSKPQILGLHHMTAITDDAQANVDFYTGILGLRLIKLTVNFDDPTAYHLYYGDGIGTPGSILTFFPYPGGYEGRIGAGQVTKTTLAVPADSIGFWTERLRGGGVEAEPPREDLDGEKVTFKAHDGLVLELVGAENPQDAARWEGEVVPFEHAIRGMYSVTMTHRHGVATQKVLQDTLGFTEVKGPAGVQRFSTGQGGSGKLVDMLVDSEATASRGGHGSVHHIAFRTGNDEEQADWHRRLEGEGRHVSPVMNRDYFRSIYFREPAGVLFEIATDGPGFTLDEPADALGTGLKLPQMYEPARAEIERVIAPLRLPGMR